ncbi:MAG: histidine kinase [Bacteroidota bacterium]
MLLKYSGLLHLIVWSIYLGFATFYKTNNLGGEVAVRHTLIAGTINILLFYSYARLVVQQFLVKEKYWYYALGSILCLIIFFHLKLRVEGHFAPEFYDFISQNSKVNMRRMIGGTILITMFLSTIITYLENRIEMEQKAQAIIRQQSEAQLLYLKSQINPHFLFNSLNNIYALAVEKSDQTPKMILQLADLLRYSIYESRKEKVSLAAEVEQIQKYLGLFRMTKEEAPNIQLETQGTLQDRAIEPMILIPLVENCVKHGDFDSNPAAFAHLHLRVDEQGIHFQTTNSKNDANQQKDKTGGVGLQNIQQRLALKYPQRYDFVTQSTERQFEVHLHIYQSPQA